MRVITRISLLAVLASLTVIPIASAAAPNSHQYIVKLKSVQTNPSAPASIHAVVGSLGGHVDFDWNDRIVVTIPDAAVAALRAHGQVKYLQRVISGPFVATATTNLEGLSTKLDLATISNSSPPWDSGTYFYDGAGNIRAIGPGSVSNDSFEYDGLSRLMRANIRNHTQTYTYDAFGNLISIGTDSPPSVFQVDQSTNHLIASPAGGSERYDTAGNDTGDGSSQTFYYDPFNMMRQKDIAASNTTTFFVYTANDERIGVITCPLGGGACGAAPSFWTWSLRDEDGKVLRQFQATYTNISTPWTWIEDYVYRDGLLLGAERVPEEGGRRHFHLDHLGSPRLVTGDSGQRMAEHDYYPFGVEIPQAFQDTAAGYDREEPMRFTGHERDFNLSTLTENANYNDDMHARQTIPAWGRFLSVDPVVDAQRAVHNPQMWNRYAYVVNNPLRYNDPTGRELPAPLEMFKPQPADSPTEKWVNRAAIGGSVVVAALAAPEVIPIATTSFLSNPAGWTSAFGAALGFFLPGPGGEMPSAPISGEFLHEVATTKGNIGILANASTEGTTLTLKDVAVYSMAKGNLTNQVGPKEMLGAVKQFGAQLKELGYTKVIIQGVRATGANPGKKTQIILDLTK